MPGTSLQPSRCPPTWLHLHSSCHDVVIWWELYWKDHQPVSLARWDWRPRRDRGGEQPATKTCDRKEKKNFPECNWGAPWLDGLLGMPWPAEYIYMYHFFQFVNSSPLGHAGSWSAHHDAPPTVGLPTACRPLVSQAVQSSQFLNMSGVTPVATHDAFRIAQ